MSCAHLDGIDLELALRRFTKTSSTLEATRSKKWPEKTPTPLRRTSPPRWFAVARPRMSAPRRWRTRLSPRPPHRRPRWPRCKPICRRPPTRSRRAAPRSRARIPASTTRPCGPPPAASGSCGWSVRSSSSPSRGCSP